MPRAIGNRKVCKDCREEKDISEFHKHSKTFDKLYPYCKSCCYERGKSYRKLNPDKNRAYAIKSYYKHIDRAKKYYLDNKEVMRESGKRWHKDNKEKVGIRNKNRVVSIRRRFLEKYGHKCSCCGETLYEFLTIEHLKGQRGQMKKENSYQAYKHALDDSYAGMYTILCMNCNHAKGKYGYCPHQSSE